MRLLVVGGSDAGISAALRARELDPAVDVQVVVADRYPNFSICGLPFLLSGETPDWRDLAHRDRGDLEAAGVELLLDTTVVAVHPSAHEVEVAPTVRLGRAGAGTRRLPYDRLVLATGAEPARPPIAGLDLPGVHLLRTMSDAFAVRERLADAGSVVVVGGGYIGVELADAFRHRDLDVHLLEMAESVLTTVHPGLGRLVTDELRRHGVDVRTTTTVERITPDDDGLLVHAEDGTTIRTDLVVVAGGVTPRTGLATAAGAATGAAGAVAVDRAMATGVPDVLAAGDGVHTHHRLLPAPTYLPLGTTAHKQGRVAGEQAVGGHGVFAGTLGTQVVKVFDLVVARTGLDDAEAARAGFRPRTVAVVVDDHKAYYPGATDLHLRLTADVADGRLLGGQIVGRVGAQVAKRVDVLATAIFHGTTVAGMSDLDLSYTPPLSSPWDPVQTVAQEWARTEETSHAVPA